MNKQPGMFDNLPYALITWNFWKEVFCFAIGDTISNHNQKSFLREIAQANLRPDSRNTFQVKRYVNGYDKARIHLQTLEALGFHREAITTLRNKLEWYIANNCNPEVELIPIIPLEAFAHERCIEPLDAVRNITSLIEKDSGIEWSISLHEASQSTQIIPTPTIPYWIAAPAIKHAPFSAWQTFGLSEWKSGQLIPATFDELLFYMLLKKTILVKNETMVILGSSTEESGEAYYPFINHRTTKDEHYYECGQTRDPGYTALSGQICSLFKSLQF